MLYDVTWMRKDLDINYHVGMCEENEQRQQRQQQQQQGEREATVQRGKYMRQDSKSRVIVELF